MPSTPTFTFQATKLLHTARGPRQLEIGFQWQEGRLMAIYGPSGAGKTTLLRILAGLTSTDTGFIEVAGEIWLDTSRNLNLPTRRRSIGFVFQDFALFPHLTARQQLEFALPDQKDSAIIDELLSLMELTELQHLRPALLSGGQQQRVALARAIARRPRLLLLDEPLSALDDDMRNKLQDYILMAHRHYGLTTLLVSHHLPEVLRLADEAIVLENGRIRSQGAPADIFTASTLAGTIASLEEKNDSYAILIQSAHGLSRLTVPKTDAASWRIGQSVTITIAPKNP